MVLGVSPYASPSGLRSGRDPKNRERRQKKQQLTGWAKTKCRSGPNEVAKSIVIGLSPNKANAKKLRGLGQDIAALWFCCMSDKPRRRLMTPDLRTLFGAQRGGNIIFVAEDDEEDPAVYRLFVPEPDTNLDRYSTNLKRTAHKVCGEPDLIRWIERGTFRFAVLLNNDGRLSKLADLIRTDDYPDLRIHLAIAPSPRELPLFIPAEKDSIS